MSTTDRIEKIVVLRAPRSRVWRALTDSQEFGTWFRARIEGAFEPGSRVQAASTYPGHEDAKWEMRIDEMVPEMLFAFLWPSDAEAQDPGQWNRVEFRLEEVAEGTQLTLVESGFDRLPPARRADARRNNEGGWTSQMENISRHVQG